MVLISAVFVNIEYRISLIEDERGYPESLQSNRSSLWMIPNWQASSKLTSNHYKAVTKWFFLISIAGIIIEYKYCDSQTAQNAFLKKEKTTQPLWQPLHPQNNESL